MVVNKNRQGVVRNSNFSTISRALQGSEI